MFDRTVPDYSERHMTALTVRYPEQTIREPARDIPVFRTCDVLVVGGGPAGTAAAASAAQVGAGTMLVGAYGHLGGLSNGGFGLRVGRVDGRQGATVIPRFAHNF